MEGKNAEKDPDSANFLIYITFLYIFLLENMSHGIGTSQKELLNDGSDQEDILAKQARIRSFIQKKKIL